jgi:TonB family protein
MRSSFASLLFALLALLPGGCAHHASQQGAPLDAEELALRRPEDSEYAARVRALLTKRQGDFRRCLEEAPERSTLGPTSFTRALYVSPGIAYFPQRSSSAPISAFESCVLVLLRDWDLPDPVTVYEGLWVLFRFERRSAEEARALNPATSSDLFELGDLRALLEISRENPYQLDAATPDTVVPVRTPVYDKEKMGRPKWLSGEKIRYTQEALANRVQGTMIVNCVLTREGSVQACRIQQPLPYMELPVLQSLFSNRYAPATLDGQPITVDYTFTIEMKLFREGSRPSRL